ncbi:glycine oxidase ThiO [Aneurinibacillus tyrosinisolvens]|uniref:glycine oxidase ThiO n=1 Tax=Aneurinibacillus tyrosinisolvens TaxID=1443435 RepID=UPI00063F6899|nr:glycine oxidase ThiO [Aneurinibacillus tyrosinisolvens]
MKKKDVVIIGGGVIGTSIAYELTKRGKSVALVEKDTIGAHASSAAGGMLGAQVEFAEPGPLFDLSLRSRLMFPDLQKELYAASGIDIQLKTPGMLRVAFTEEEKSTLMKQAEWQTAMGLPATWLDTKEVRRMEPAVTDGIVGALFLTEDTQVSAPDLTKAFAVAAAKHGAAITENCEAIEFYRQGEQMTGIETTAGKLEADEYVIAGGAWSGKIMKQLGHSLPIFPVKGEAFSVLSIPHPIEKTIYSHGCYIVPKSGDRLLVGASVKDCGFDARLTIDGLQQLMAKAVRLLPVIKDCPLEKTWASLRPQTADGLPYFGRLSAYNNVSIAAGHFRNGILLSPITGQLIAQLLSGEATAEALEPFTDIRHSIPVSQ